MVWISRNIKWIRPIKHIFCIFNKQNISINFEGIQSSNYFCGNYQYGNTKLKCNSFKEYEDKLKENYVILRGEKRKNRIDKLLTKYKIQNYEIIYDKSTIDSVEFPNLYIGSFDKSYLKLPTSFLISVISGKQNEDPASVVFKAHQNSIKDETELLIIDTAGRLHNKIELMEELKKIHRVIQKNDPSAPHEKILILDSTIGQNTYSQIEAFRDIIGISGVIMTKLDGSSKGGALIGITKKYKIPIYAIGLGEQLEDLIAFNPLEYVDTLLGTNFGEKNESLH